MPAALKHSSVINISSCGERGVFVHTHPSPGLQDGFMSELQSLKNLFEVQEHCVSLYPADSTSVLQYL